MATISPTAPVGVLAFGAGVSLIWSAFTGQSPLAELRKVLQSGRVDGADVGGTPFAPGNADSTSTSTSTSTPSGILAIGTPLSAGVASPTSTSTPPGNLVSIGQGGHRLRADAAAAFKRAEALFGTQIKITDSVRSYDQQKSNYARDPRRFGNPDTNAHVQGEAVDVHLPALGANPQGSAPRQWLNDATYARLYNAMTSVGFCNYQVKNGTTGNKVAEPWHFSFGRCA